MSQTALTTHTGTLALSENHSTSGELHATTEHHAGPHIPGTQGEVIDGLSVMGLSVTNTILSTWIFMVFLFVFVAILYTAIRTEMFPRIRAFGLDIITKLDEFLKNALSEKRIARKFLPLVG